MSSKKWGTGFLRIDFNLEILCRVKNKNVAFCKRNFLEQFSLPNLQTELLEWFTTKVYFTISLYVSYILDHNRSLYFSLWSIHFHRKRFLHLNALGITQINLKAQRKLKFKPKTGRECSFHVLILITYQIG